MFGVRCPPATTRELGPPSDTRAEQTAGTDVGFGPRFALEEVGEGLGHHATVSGCASRPVLGQTSGAGRPQPRPCGNSDRARPRLRSILAGRC
jgi:hypothetical protein